MIMEIKKGQRYRHFKGRDYEVAGVARDCEDSSREIVAYKALYDGGEFPKGQLWTRSLEDFVGEKDFEDGRIVKRFVLVE